ncbi:hypothetical protein TELCIR_15393, partial [Teladorsagia circumcincta]
SVQMEQSKDQLTVPVNRPLHLNLNELTFTDPSGRKPIYLEHSPVLSQKIKIPKKRYSYADPLERMDTPVFDKSKVSNVKKGPSSAATVLTMAGMFVVGILLIMSGMIVLIASLALFLGHPPVQSDWDRSIRKNSHGVVSGYVVLRERERVMLRELEATHTHTHNRKIPFTDDRRDPVRLSLSYSARLVTYSSYSPLSHHSPTLCIDNNERNHYTARDVADDALHSMEMHAHTPSVTGHREQSN